MPRRVPCPSRPSRLSRQVAVIHKTSSHVLHPQALRHRKHGPCQSDSRTSAAGRTQCDHTSCKARRPKLWRRQKVPDFPDVCSAAVALTGRKQPNMVRATFGGGFQRPRTSDPWRTTLQIRVKIRTRNVLTILGRRLRPRVDLNRNQDLNSRLDALMLSTGFLPNSLPQFLWASHWDGVLTS
jgi:hypothetical protein